MAQVIGLPLVVRTLVTMGKWVVCLHGQRRGKSVDPKWRVTLVHRQMLYRKILPVLQVIIMVKPMEDHEHLDHLEKQMADALLKDENPEDPTIHHLLDERHREKTSTMTWV
jgi:hypothetical protein